MVFSILLMLAQGVSSNFVVTGDAGSCIRMMRQGQVWVAKNICSVPVYASITFRNPNNGRYNYASRDIAPYGDFYTNKGGVMQVHQIHAYRTGKGDL